MNKTTISMALAALVFQAGDVSSAIGVLVDLNFYGYNAPVANSNPALPFMEVYLKSNDGAFISGSEYAGVFTGTVSGVDGGPTTFFCAELNHTIGWNSTSFESTSLFSAAYHDGSLVTTGGGVYNNTLTGVDLTNQQQCMLVGVYKALGVTTALGFTTTAGIQDLSGTTAQASTLTGLTDMQAAAAQLVMWEIIHEPVSWHWNNMAPVINLTAGKLEWYADGIDSSLGTAFSAQFNTYATAAYVHAIENCSLVPEVTSPVALIAGGLLFLRRREPRALRLAKSGGFLK